MEDDFESMIEIRELSRITNKSLVTTVQPYPFSEFDIPDSRGVDSSP